MMAPKAQILKVFRDIIGLLLLRKVLTIIPPQGEGMDTVLISELMLFHRKSAPRQLTHLYQNSHPL